MATGAAGRGRGGGALVKHGLPFVGLMVAGSLGLALLLQGRRDLERVKDDEEWAAITKSRNLTKHSTLQRPQRTHSSLEEQLKVMQERINIDSYENKPLPRALVKE